MPFFALLLLLLSACSTSDRKSDDPSLSTKIPLVSSHPVLYQTESGLLQWDPTQFGNEETKFEIDLTEDPSLVFQDLGSLEHVDNSTVRYIAPGFIPKSRRIRVKATSGDKETVSATVYLVAQSDAAFALNSEDTGSFASPIAYIYSLPTPVMNFLPNFAQLSSPERALIKRLDFPYVELNQPDRRFYGVTDKKTNFAMKIEGSLRLPLDGNYDFHLQANDGAQFFVDGQLLINADRPIGGYGQTYPRPYKASVVGFALTYFQLSDVASLQLRWNPPMGVTGSGGFVNIPSDSLLPPR